MRFKVTITKTGTGEHYGTVLDSKDARQAKKDAEQYFRSFLADGGFELAVQKHTGVDVESIDVAAFAKKVVTLLKICEDIELGAKGNKLVDELRGMLGD